MKIAPWESFSIMLFTALIVFMAGGVDRNFNFASGTTANAATLYFTMVILWRLK